MGSNGNSLFFQTAATKPQKLEFKSFYKQLNDLPNMSYVI